MNIMEKAAIYILIGFTVLIALKQTDIETGYQQAKESQDIKIVELEAKIKRIFPRRITVTAYSSTVRQTNEKPFQTAYLEPVRRWIIACSNDLIEDGWLPKDHVYLYEVRNGREYGLGRFLIADRMPPETEEHCDIWVPDEAFAWKIGKMEDVRAFLLKDMI